MMSSAIQPPAPRVATYSSPAVGAPGRGSWRVERERFAIRGGLARVRHPQFSIELGRARDRRRHELVGAAVGQPPGEAAAHLFVGTRRLFGGQRGEGLVGTRRPCPVRCSPRHGSGRSFPGARPLADAHTARDSSSFTDASFREGRRAAVGSPRYGAVFEAVARLDAAGVHERAELRFGGADFGGELPVDHRRGREARTPRRCLWRRRSRIHARSLDSPRPC